MVPITRALWAACGILSAACCVPAPLAAQTTYDLVIRHGRALDGTGNPWRAADIGVLGDRIAAVGDLRDARARREIDATGLYVAPGFIDVHSHAAPGLATEELSHARPLLTQGVTTIIGNPDGGGPVDLAGQREALLRHGLGVNVGLLAPHGSIRQAVLGSADRAPTADELERMRHLLRTAMENGALGLSSGLYYAPGSYATTEEVIALAAVAADYGGVYTSHIRDESNYSVGVVAAVEEVITIARQARLPGIVTHIKVLGPEVWGTAGELVDRIAAARARGVELYADQYPYDASGTSIVGALVPRWALVGGNAALRGRLADPAQRARIRAEMLRNIARRGGAERLLVSSYPPDRSLEGTTLAETAAQRQIEPVDLALAMLERGDASLISFNMSEADVETLMRQPWTITASDGDLTRPGEGMHPRGTGTFPRKIRRYALERRTVTLEDAIRSMTGLPAAAFRLADRGTLRPGAAADIVVFDLDRVRDHATYQDPHALSEGMVWVIVNGGIAIDNGAFRDGRYGRVLGR